MQYTREENGTVLLKTVCGRIRGLEKENCLQFLGVMYAHAGRFEYAVPQEHWDGVLEAVRFGCGCPQNRAVNEHLDNPTRLFYKKEFRAGLEFHYDEDCLNMNIYTPKGADGCPVVIFIYGGGFDSGLNCEGPMDGTKLAERGVIAAFINYRVGPLGYLTHPKIRQKYGRDGNFGLDDQLTAIRWMKAHAADFGGDPDNITLIGQSAGAISIQYLSLNPVNKGLFRRAVMMSGAGLFPKFSLPKKAEETHEYWQQFIELAGCRDLDELKAVPTDRLFDAVEAIKAVRKDSIYHTMPVVDGLLIPRPIDEMIRTPLPIGYMIGYTNSDMYAPIMAYIGNRYGRANDAYIYYFDLDAPGDDNRAFHSCDLRYVFETLDTSWRPYGERDREVSGQLAGYIANFAKTGDPNAEGLPEWTPAGKHVPTKVLRITKEKTAMGHVHYFKLIRNFLTKGDPRA